MPGADWGAGDRVVVAGRFAVVKRDMRPQHNRATLVWEDTGEEQKRVDASSIASAGVPAQTTKLAQKRRRKEGGPLSEKITLISAPDVSPELQQAAQSWSLWDSTTHQFDEPESACRFEADYSDVFEHKVLVVSGKGTITPDGSDEPITLSPGDAVTFRQGAKCTWHIIEPMLKHFAYFDQAGKHVREF